MILFSRIKQFPVFCITAIFSILAYMWLLVVLVFSSKDKVDVWEAVVTFLLFPILVVIAYCADKGWLNKLFCYNPDKVDAKQQQIELGNFQPGECKYIVPGCEENMKINQCWQRI